MPLTEADVGKLFTKGDPGDERPEVWRMETYAAEPTVTMVNCETGDKLSGTVSSLNMRAMKRLVVEGGEK